MFLGFGWITFFPIFPISLIFQLDKTSSADYVSFFFVALFPLC